MSKDVLQLLTEISAEFTELDQIAIDRQHIEQQIELLLAELREFAHKRVDLDLMRSTTNLTLQVADAVGGEADASGKFQEAFDTVKEHILQEVAEDNPAHVAALEHVLEMAKKATAASRAARDAMLDILQTLKQLKADNQPKP